MAEPLDYPALPCPECRANEVKGRARIGNRRSRCTTCNNWAQAVMRLTRKRLMERHEEEYQVLRMRVESDLYPKVMEDWRHVTS